MVSEAPAGGLRREKCYEANINGYKDVGGHVEYCLKLDHCSGVSWSLWRRFSEFLQLHEDILALTDEKDQLPAGPERSWLPAFTQSLSADFCQQREVELGAYLKRLIATPKILDLSPLQDFLGIRSPEPPAGLRVVPRANALELEVSPPDSEAFRALPRSGEHGGPVDGYWIEILNLDTGKKNRLKREVGASGRLMQTARVGRLEAGRHCFACAAFNVAGCSSPVSVTVDPVICGPTEQNPACMPVQQQLQPPTFANSARGYLPRPQLGEGPAPLPIQPANGSGWGPSPGSGQRPVQRGRVPQDSRPTNQLQIQRPQQPQLPHMQIQRQQQQQNYLFQPQVLGPGTAPMGLTSYAKSRASKPLSSADQLGAAKASNHPKDEEDEDSLCVVCLAAPKTHAFAPCGHRCVCAPCAKEVFPDRGSCPVCRAEAQNVIQIFT